MAGLILGIAFYLIILLWVQDEQHIDKFHKNSSRIYNIYEREFADGKVQHDYSTPGLLADELKKKIPDVQEAAVYGFNDEKTIKVGEKIMKFRGQYANEDFLKIFNYPLIEGNIGNALNSPAGIAISGKMATEFFGRPADAMGKGIKIDNKDDFIITAVFEDVPDNSSLQFDLLINWHNFMKKYPWFADFGNTSPFTTVLLRDKTDPKEFRAKIKNFLDQYEVGEGPGYRLELDMQRYDEMYLHSNFQNGQLSGGRIEYVRIFSIVAISILLIACINFTNLITASSLKRAREIGVHKIVGATRKTLIGQFMSEAMMLCFVASFVGSFIVFALLPTFNNLTGKHIPTHQVKSRFGFKY
jgi:putative ABC transport system permease protein